MNQSESSSYLNFVRSDLGPNSLERLSTQDNSRNWLGKSYDKGRVTVWPFFWPTMDLAEI